MRKMIFLVIPVLFAACGQNEKPAGVEPVEEVRESRYKRLLSKYKDKSFDTLHVYSPEELVGEYKGVELDSNDAVLFPREIAEHHFRDQPGLFAVYKFRIDKQVTALITRTPSDYVPSSVKLFFYDRAKDSITSYVELAESWGDAGDVWIKDAWLFKVGGAFQAFVLVRETHYNEVENPDDTSAHRLQHYALLDLSKGGDSLSTDGQQLDKQFNHLIRKVSN